MSFMEIGIIQFALKANLNYGRLLSQAVNCLAVLNFWFYPKLKFRTKTQNISLILNFFLFLCLLTQR